jgi:hypothetical protein
MGGSGQGREKVVSQFEFPNQARNSAATNQKHPKPKTSQATILILRCRCSMDSPELDFGGFSETLRCRIFGQYEKAPIAPIRQMITGKVIFMVFQRPQCASPAISS